MKKGLALLLLLSMMSPSSGGQKSRRPGHAQSWWSHVSFLADDALQGRETGSAGDRKAAEYIAGIFKRIGLKPAGTTGYFQPIRLRARRIVEEQSRLSLVRPEGVEPIVLGDEAAFNMRIDPAAHVEAPIVFVGYGLTVPELNYDDLSGLDLHGKVALLLAGGPTSIPDPLKAYYETQRWKFLRRAGAIGVLQIENPRKMDIPWERSRLRRLMPQMTLEDASLDENAGEQLAVTLNPAHAEHFFTGSGHTFQDLLTLADTGAPLPRFSLPTAIRASTQCETWPVESRNVVAVLPGTDPKLKNEYVVLTAHFDHLGIQGSHIYNGAMDNAAGVATLLETAIQLRKSGRSFRRSIVFLAVTAEEKGLLGSRYFVAHPTVPATGIVAQINTDMFLPLFDMRMLMVQGLEESSLGTEVRSVAKAEHVDAVDDPEPERNSYTRSDQYNFVKRGVPAVALKIGYTKGSPEQETVKRWRKERYHGPADDLEQPIDFQAAADFNRVYLKIVESVANRAKRPEWTADSFFRRFAQ